MAKLPERIGDYRLLEPLGEGAMGEVLLAEHVPTGARRALKLLRSNDLTLLLRFKREAEAQARVDSHPNIVRVHSAGQAGHLLYIVMDLAEGGDLQTRLRSGPLEPETARALTLALARGLAHVHASGVLHRDLKPANVLFSEDGIPMLTDFGLARMDGAESLTATGTMLGTPAYMAPEQADPRLGPTDERSDVYGLSALLYHCLTGQPPFSGGSALGIAVAVISDAPRPPRTLVPSIPAGLEAICLRGLEKTPANRFPSAAAFAQALADGTLAAPRSTARWWLLAVIVVPLLAGGALLALSSSPPQRPQPALEPDAPQPDVPQPDPLELSAPKPGQLQQAARALEAGKIGEVVASLRRVDMLRATPEERAPLAQSIRRQAQRLTSWLVRQQNLSHQELIELIELLELERRLNPDAQLDAELLETLEGLQPSLSTGVSPFLRRPDLAVRFADLAPSDAPLQRIIALNHELYDYNRSGKPPGFERATRRALPHASGETALYLRYALVQQLVTRGAYDECLAEAQALAPELTQRGQRSEVLLTICRCHCKSANGPDEQVNLSRLRTALELLDRLVAEGASYQALRGQELRAQVQWALADRELDAAAALPLRERALADARRFVEEGRFGGPELPTRTLLPAVERVWAYARALQRDAEAAPTIAALLEKAPRLEHSVGPLWPWCVRLAWLQEHQSRRAQALETLGDAIKLQTDVPRKHPSEHQLPSALRALREGDPGPLDALFMAVERPPPPARDVLPHALARLEENRLQEATDLLSQLDPTEAPADLLGPVLKKLIERRRWLEPQVLRSEPSHSGHAERTLTLIRLLEVERRLHDFPEAPQLIKKIARVIMPDQYTGGPYLRHLDVVAALAELAPDDQELQVSAALACERASLESFDLPRPVLSPFLSITRRAIPALEGDARFALQQRYVEMLLESERYSDCIAQVAPLLPAHPHDYRLRMSAARSELKRSWVLSGDERAAALRQAIAHATKIKASGSHRHLELLCHARWSLADLARAAGDPEEERRERARALEDALRWGMHSTLLGEPASSNQAWAAATAWSYARASDPAALPRVAPILERVLKNAGREPRYNAWWLRLALARELGGEHAKALEAFDAGLGTLDAAGLASRRAALLATREALERGDPEPLQAALAELVASRLWERGDHFPGGE